MARRLLSLFAAVVTAALSLFVITLTANRPPGYDAARPEDRPVPGWHARHQALVAACRAGGLDVLVVGDSLTEGWDAHRDVWADRVTGRPTAFFGIGGDTTNHLLWRLAHGELDGPPPKLVVVLIGTNNPWPSDDPGNNAAGVLAVVGRVRARVPSAKVLLLGLPPRERDPDAVSRRRFTALNALLAARVEPPAVYRDIGRALLEPDGRLSEAVSDDGTHFTRRGYERWADALGPVVRELLGE